MYPLYLIHMKVKICRKGSRLLYKRKECPSRTFCSSATSKTKVTLPNSPKKQRFEKKAVTFDSADGFYSLMPQSNLNRQYSAFKARR